MLLPKLQDTGRSSALKATHIHSKYDINCGLHPLNSKHWSSPIPTYCSYQMYRTSTTIYFLVNLVSWCTGTGLPFVMVYTGASLPGTMYMGCTMYTSASLPGHLIIHQPTRLAGLASTIETTGADMTAVRSPYYGHLIINFTCSLNSPDSDT